MGVVKIIVPLLLASLFAALTWHTGRNLPTYFREADGATGASEVLRQVAFFGAGFIAFVLAVVGFVVGVVDVLR